MILADFLSLSIKLIIIGHVVVSLLLVLVVLMQRPKQEGLGAAFGGGVTDGVWGARTTDVLQRGTVYLGTLFFVLALVLAILVGKDNARKKAVATNDSTETEEVQAEAEETEEAVEEAVDELEKELLEADGGGDDQSAMTTEESTEEETPATEDAPVETPVTEDPPAETPVPEGGEQPNNG